MEQRTDSLKRIRPGKKNDTSKAGVIREWKRRGMCGKFEPGTVQ
jgi:hypothetical protein